MGVDNEAWRVISDIKLLMETAKLYPEWVYGDQNEGLRKRFATIDHIIQSIADTVLNGKTESLSPKNLDMILSELRNKLEALASIADNHVGKHLKYHIEATRVGLDAILSTRRGKTSVGG